jgi:hypothetical protein
MTRWTKWTGAALVVGAIALGPTGRPALAQSGEAITDAITYETQMRVAWVIAGLLCGPDTPERIDGPAPVEACRAMHNSALLYLGFLLALADLPEGSDGQGIIGTMPEIDQRLLAWAMHNQREAEPDWQVEATDALDGVPANMVSMVIQPVRDAYETTVRLAFIQAEMAEPDLLADAEMPVPEGTGDAHAGGGSSSGDPSTGDSSAGSDAGTSEAPADPQAAPVQK